MNLNFKKLVSRLVTVLILTSNINLSAQDITPGVISLSQSGNSIIIDFQLPEYSIENTNIYDEYGINQYYANISIDNFGQIFDVGYPELPQLTVDLHVPEDATTFNVSTSNIQTETKYLSYKIMPTQEDDDDEDPQFVIENSYYQSSGYPYNFNYKVSEPFMLMTAQGISFSIFPFQYNPSLNKLTVIKNIRFTVTHNGTISTLKSGTISSDVDEYLSSVFYNYSRLKSGTIDRGNYLIITAPAYENTLTYFANYKRNIGYDVTVVNTTTTGTTSGDIENYIQTQYNNSTTRPDYVLLVGDVNDIPASGGTERDKDDPLTDLNYARLDGNDHFADVFLGRFSVASTADLQNVINKTIDMERRLSSLTKHALLLSGGGDGEDRFDNPLRKVMDKGLDGYTHDFLFTVDGHTDTDVYNAIDNTDYHLIIFRGHGGSDVIGSIYDIEDTDINNRTNTSFPVFFSIACQTGNFGFPSECIGETWIRSSLGGTAFFGATTNSGRNSNQRITKKLFIDAYTERDRLGQITNLGMKRYYKSFWSWWGGGSNKRKRQIKKYNLLGDPSLYVRGIGCTSDFVFTNNEVFHSGDVIIYHASNDIVVGGDETFEVNAGSDVTLIAGNSIKLDKGFKAEAGAVFKAYIEPCNSSSLKSAQIDNRSITNYKTEETTEIVKNSKEEFIKIYPNPVSNRLIIEYNLKAPDNVFITLTDINGKTVQQLVNAKQQEKGFYKHEIQIKDLSVGTYIYSVIIGTEKHQGKILKIE